MGNPRIEFEKDGDISVYDADGKPVAPEPIAKSVEEIIGGCKVKNAESMTVLELEGSCYRTVWWRGKWWRFPC